MNVQVEKLEKNTAKMTIEIPAETFVEAIDKAYLKQKKNIVIDGFRKGKVPKNIVEKVYGEGVFYEEAADIVLMSEYPKAAEESGLKILSRPDVEITQIGKDKPFIFTAVVAIYPEDVTLGKYDGVEIPKIKVEVTEEDIDKFLKQEQEKNSRIITIEDRGAELGDTVVIDYVGTVDGVEFDGGAGQNYPLVLGSNSFVPGFEDQLVGVKAGDQKDVNVSFPEKYRAEELAGKAAVFACTVHRVEKKELPEIDDEFAQEVSEFDTLAEYKEDVKKIIEAEKTETAKNEKIMSAVEKVTQDSNVEIPEILVDETATRMVNNIADRLKQQGMTIDQYLKYMGTTAEKFKQQMVPQAINDLKTQFVLEKIAEVEKLEATEEAFEKRLADMSAEYRIDVEEAKKIINPQMKEQMMKDLIPQIAAEWVGAHAVEDEAAEEESK